MAGSLINRCLAYLLLILLPLQAAAWGRMTVCAEITPPSHSATVSMAHCHDMTARTQPLGDRRSHSHPDGAGCWIGSICIATVAAFAVSTQHSIALVDNNNPTYPSVIALYQSVILDGLQRPPAIL